MLCCGSSSEPEPSSAANAAAEDRSVPRAASFATPAAAAPTGSDEKASSPSGHLSLTNVLEPLDQARNAVLLLGRSAWHETREKSAQALASLARVLDAADGQGGAARQLDVLRTQSARLGGSGTADDFAHVESIATGLSSALLGLELLQLADPGSLRPWLDAAHEAIVGLEQGATTPALRAATVQDAFRATLDAFQVAVQLSSVRAGCATASAVGTARGNSTLGCSRR